MFFVLLKALFVLQILTFLSQHFGYLEKRFDKKARVNFKIYDVNYNTYIAQYLKK